MKHEFEIDGQTFPVTLTRQGEEILAQVQDRAYRIQSWARGHILLDDCRSLEYAVSWDDRCQSAQVSVLGCTVPVKVAGSRTTISRSSSGQITAPMNGQVVKVLKKPGDQVLRGEVVLVLEAMKMENEVAAPSDGLLERLEVVPGQNVAPGDMLFQVKVTPA